MTQPEKVITDMKIVYQDKQIIVCIKDAGILSTDEPGGMPACLRASGCVKDIYVVHRLDREVSGLMVYALTKEAAAALCRAVADRVFSKEYLAVVHGKPENTAGVYEDLLFHDRAKNRTYIVNRQRKGVREAALAYNCLGTVSSPEGCPMSLVHVRLITGRTHQIRAQFASRGMPLSGDGHYGASDRTHPVALWSWRIAFEHPQSKKRLVFTEKPPLDYPWSLFSASAGSGFPEPALSKLSRD